MSPEIFNKELFDPKKGDLFACGVVLFNLILGDLPFIAASPRDKCYNQIMNGNFEEFWQIHEQLHHSSLGKKFDQFKDLFIKMVHPDVDQRLTIDEIKDHDWFNGVVIDEEELV